MITPPPGSRASSWRWLGIALSEIVRIAPRAVSQLGFVIGREDCRDRVVLPGDPDIALALVDIAKVLRHQILPPAVGFARRQPDAAGIEAQPDIGLTHGQLAAMLREILGREI